MCVVFSNEVGAESRAKAPLVGGVAAHDEGTEQREEDRHAHDGQRNPEQRAPGNLQSGRDENTDKQEGVEGARPQEAIAVAAPQREQRHDHAYSDDRIDRDDRAQLPHVTGLRLAEHTQAQVAQASDKPAGQAVDAAAPSRAGRERLKRERAGHDHEGNHQQVNPGGPVVGEAVQTVSGEHEAHPSGSYDSAASR